MTCVFCDIVAERAPATVVNRHADALVIVPLNPVTPGHVIVIPTTHVSDAAAHPFIAAAVMMHAASWAKPIGPCNIITSIGEEATQSIFHLHIHVVPRRKNDGLPLPWTSRQPMARVEAELAELKAAAMDVVNDPCLPDEYDDKALYEKLYNAWLEKQATLRLLASGGAK